MTAEDITATVLEELGTVARVIGPKFGRVGSIVAMGVAAIARTAAAALRGGKTVEQILADIKMPPRAVDTSWRHAAPSTPRPPKK